jgi:hypothetical protein
MVFCLSCDTRKQTLRSLRDRTRILRRRQRGDQPVGNRRKDALRPTRWTTKLTRPRWTRKSRNGSATARKGGRVRFPKDTVPGERNCASRPKKCARISVPPSHEPGSRRSDRGRRPLGAGTQRPTLRRAEAGPGRASARRASGRSPWTRRARRTQSRARRRRARRCWRLFESRGRRAGR